MDPHTIELLQFDKVRGLLIARAACSLGKQAAGLLEPSADSAEVHDRQLLTTEMVEAIESGLTPSFGGLHDIRQLVRRAQVGAMLEAEELAETVETLRALGELDRWLARIGESFPRLGGMRHGVGEFSGVTAAIESCIDSRGKVLDTASRRLSVLRRDIGAAEERIQESLRRMLRSPEIKRILRYPNFTMVGHHYVLPVAKDHRGEVQGSVQRTSATNETVYIEPTAIAEQSAQLSYLRAKEAKEIRRILRWLSAQVGLVAESLTLTLAIMARLDLIHAGARLSADYRMSPPDMNEQGRLVLRQARHPILEAIFQGEPALAAGARPDVAVAAGQAAEDEGPPVRAVAGEAGSSVPNSPPATRQVVPIDVHLGVQFQIMVVTGPNTGGKTVALKTVGLLALMAQAGLHVPTAPGSSVPVFDVVLADIGDEQSLEQSLSTFSSHVSRISRILGQATERSLVLLDELGAGTDPAEGGALGRAILDELDSIGCRAIVTTHLGELKSYALSNPRAENAAVEFDIETLQPKYRVHIGDVGQSNALKIARRLNMAEHVVARAEDYLEGKRGAAVPEWELVQKLRKEAEEARLAALAAQAEAEQTRERLAGRLAELDREARRDEQVAEARARLQAGDRVVVPRLGYDRPGRIVRIDPRKKMAVVAIGHVSWDVALDELIPQAVRQPGAPEAPVPGSPRPTRPRPLQRLEDFSDE